MAGATRIVTPDKVRQLQIALYRKAKASPKYRFWSLYGELLRMDVLERALEAQFRNDGGGGVDGESLAAIKPRRRQWLERTKRWLTAKGLKLNEVKTRVVDIRQEGINFLGFSLTWRKSRQGRGYLHVEPSQKSRTALQEHLRDILNHWTQWKPIAAVVGKVNEVLRGWSAYFHFRNSSSVMGTMKRYSQNRFRRWLWRKQGCKRGLWSHYTAEKLHTHYGLMVLPTTAAWKAAR